MDEEKKTVLIGIALTEYFSEFAKPSIQYNGILHLKGKFYRSTGYNHS